MRGKVWFGLALLCLLAGSEWIADLVVPRFLPALLGLSVRCGFVAVVAAALGWRRRGRWGDWRILSWGVCLLVPLPLVYAGAGASVSFLTKLLVGAFVPVAVVFLRAQDEQGFGVERGQFGLLVPALAGFGGSALVIAYVVPVSAIGRVWLLLIFVASLATGVGVVRLHEVLRGVEFWRGVGTVTGGVAVVAGGLCWVGWQPWVVDGRGLALGLGRLVLVDGPVLVLTVWLVREMEPVGFAARYLLVPLVTVVESYVVVRAGGDWTMGLGVMLMAGASWMLLREKAAGQDAG